MILWADKATFFAQKWLGLFSKQYFIKEERKKGAPITSF